MAFSSTVENIVNIAGNRKIGTGTFAQAGTSDTGGDIDISGFYLFLLPDKAQYQMFLLNLQDYCHYQENMIFP